ncbi:uncharacterized protein LOC133922623 [Phragmites australis]|uniref:uncharacterized protein LOC133922623 n=1 Tax=Phragmites australis TaxID=29695 RepID=UPI002D76ADD3|nr:uncharacterized protein LOC133922623 [Phragmites australis]XP_062224010.1 uncharacterized protein LOC133922623 [Phragmites australis]
MENAAAIAAYEPAVLVGEPAVLVGEPPLRQPGFPRLRGRRLNAAVYVAVWGVTGILSTTIPGLNANRDRVLLHFLALMAGLLLMVLSVAAPDLPVVERAAAHLEGLVGAMF